MGFLARFEKKVVPPTAESPAVDVAAAQTDSEKMATSQLEGHHGIAPAQNIYYVKPEVEKRLLKKMDQRLVPLVMVLCMTRLLKQ
jgi:hypothetical protein